MRLRHRERNKTEIGYFSLSFAPRSVSLDGVCVRLEPAYVNGDEANEENGSAVCRRRCRMYYRQMSRKTARGPSLRILDDARENKFIKSLSPLAIRTEDSPSVVYMLFRHEFNYWDHFFPLRSSASLDTWH